MLKDEIVEDMKSLGGFWLYLVITAVFAGIGEGLIALGLLVVLALAFIIIICIRSLFFRPRPKPYKYRTWYDRIDASSFPSMHATRAAILAIFLTYLMDSVFLGVVFSLCAVGVAAARVVGKKHHVSDVVAGLILGSLLGGLGLLILTMLALHFAFPPGYPFP